MRFRRNSPAKVPPENADGGGGSEDSVCIPAAAVFDLQLAAGALRLLEVLAVAAGADRRFNVCSDQVADRLRRRQRTLRSYVSQLTRRGYIKSTLKPGEIRGRLQFDPTGQANS